MGRMSRHQALPEPCGSCSRVERSWPVRHVFPRPELFGQRAARTSGVSAPAGEPSSLSDASASHNRSAASGCSSEEVRVHLIATTPRDCSDARTPSRCTRGTGMTDHDHVAQVQRPPDVLDVVSVGIDGDPSGLNDASEAAKCRRSTKTSCMCSRSFIREHSSARRATRRKPNVQPRAPHTHWCHWAGVGAGSRCIPSVE